MSDPADSPEPRRRRPGKGRIFLPWWVLACLGALAGFVTAQWTGLVIGGVLGWLAWKLR